MREDDEAYFESYTLDLSHEELRRLVDPILLEYLENGDFAEALESIAPFENQGAKLVNLIVNLGLDKQDEKREMISVLLAEGHGSTFEVSTIAEAFSSLLSSAPDLAIDIPNISVLLGKFIARGIVDRALPPHFLGSLKPESPVAEEIIRHAQVFLDRNSGHDLDTIWGVSGGQRPVKLLAEKITILIQEYFSSSEKEEATRCLQSLGVPHFHHELVYEIIVMAAEKKEREMTLALELLKSMKDASVLTIQQLSQGFERIFSDSADISLDIPTIYSFLDSFCPKAVQAGLISSQLAEQVPSKGRKRYLSENDGGKLKN